MLYCKVQILLTNVQLSNHKSTALKACEGLGDLGLEESCWCVRQTQENSPLAGINIFIKL